MKSILIIGAGQFGTHIAKRFTELRCDVMAVDIDEENINSILPFVTNAQIGDSTNAKFMGSLGIRNYDVCIVTISDNFQNSLETTALLKELGAKEVISRAANDVQEKFLLRNGADEVIYPEKQMALRIATRFASDNILDSIQMDSNYSIYEIRVPKEWIGKSIIQLDIRKKYNINIISLKRFDRFSMPLPDSVFMANDIALVLGELKDIKKCFKF